MAARAKAAAATPANVVIVEDHQMFREWLGRMICEDGTFTVCGEADNIKSAITIIQRTKPDIVLLDITLRGSSGLELLKDMRALEIEIPVLVLSMHDASLYAERVLRAGARGYISKHAASSTLLKALRQVLEGEIYFDKQATSIIFQKIAKPGFRKKGMDALADRELEVLQLIGKGLATHEIARQLSLGETTVETYRARIKEKLGLRNILELYTFATRWLQEQEA
jgi:DNA-binding NarL/FixJ family response regulator